MNNQLDTVYKYGVYFIKTKGYIGHAIVDKVIGKKSFDFTPIIGMSQNGTVNDLNSKSNALVSDTEVMKFVKFAVKSSSIKQKYNEGIITTKNGDRIRLKKGDRVSFKKEDNCYVEGFEKVDYAKIKEILEVDGYFNYTEDHHTCINHCHGFNVLEISIVDKKERNKKK